MNVFARRRRQGRRDRDREALRGLGGGGRVDRRRRGRRRDHRRPDQRRRLARNHRLDRRRDGAAAWVSRSRRATSTNKLELYAGNISFGDSAGIGVATVVLVHNGTVDAHVASGSDAHRGCRRGDRLGDPGPERRSSSRAPARAAATRASPARSSSTCSTTRRPRRSTARRPPAARSRCRRATRPTSSPSPASWLSAARRASGVGADVEVITKDTEATIAPSASVATTGAGDVTVGASSQEYRRPGRGRPRRSAATQASR